jgi:Penicillin binding protein transpeptidase domain
MKRLARSSAALIALLLLLSVIGIFREETFAKTTKKSTKSGKSSRSTASSSRKKNSSATTARRSSKSSKRTVARSSKASKRSLARSRARARYLARLRVIRARDAALRNSAAANIVRDATLGEDQGIRRIAVNALSGRSGTVVVMDTTGRIYTVVNQVMALGSPVKPCSTVKMIVGLGALHESVFDPNREVQFARNGYGLILTDAIAKSNNPFFQVLGRRLGYERVMRYATNYGFGEPTGINIPGEDPGFLPDPGDQETGHMSSHGDGFGVTAIQLAAFTAAIANGGNLYVPRVPTSREDAMNFQPVLRRKIDMTPEERLRMLAGMSGAVNFGTAKAAYDPVGQVAGKTGTCTGSRDRLGLFTSFSSVDNPKLIVTVVTTGSTEAGKRAAEIAGRVYRAISGSFLREQQVTPAAAAIELQLPRNE